MKKILLVSGEPSGDQHAARLVHDIKNIHPNTRFLGMGGDAMQAAGVHIVVDAKNLAVVGIVEVIGAFFRIVKAFWQLKSCLKKEKPDLVILIDYPGFNLRFARTAKKAGCQVMYYIAPQLWAWGSGRIRWIQRYVDQVCVVFPFEEAFYRQRGVHAHFVGHPLTNHVQPTLSKEAALKHFFLSKTHPMIALLPGSRNSEMQSLLPILLDFAQLLRQKYPTAQFILPIAPSINQTALKEKIAHAPDLPIHLTEHTLYDALSLCDIAVAASGTVTLECGLLEIPTVLIYKFHPLTYWIAKRITHSPYLGICNILANQSIMKELIQDKATPQNINQEVQRFLENPHYLKQVLTKLKKIKKTLKGPETKESPAAHWAIRLLKT